MSLGHKKGDAQYYTVVSLIILILAFVATFFVWKSFYGRVDAAGQDEACRLSIQAAAQTKSLPSLSTVPGSRRSYVPLKCPSQTILLQYKDVVVGGEIDQEKAHEILAEELYRCWSKVGEGKIDPFSNWDGKGESYCLLCGVVQFDEPLKDFINNHASKLTADNLDKYLVTSPESYLATHTVPKGEHQGETYWEYLWHTKPPQLTQEELGKLKKTIVLPGTAIVVNMYKYDSKSTTLTVLYYAAAGVAIVGAGLILLPVTATGGLIAIFSIAGLKAAALTAVGAYTVSRAFTSSFSGCPECEGYGTIQLVYNQEAFSKEIPIEIAKGDKKETKQVPLCTQLVNA